MWDLQGRDELRGLLKDVQNRESIDLETLVEGSLHAVEHTIASAIPAVVRCSMADFQHTSFILAQPCLECLECSSTTAKQEAVRV